MTSSPDDVATSRVIWSTTSGDEGAPLVALVHGSMDRSAGVLRLSRRLDARFRVLRYDRRGYGRSSAAPGPWTVAANVDDLERLVEGHLVDDGRAVIVGHSFGGVVALGLAARRPDLVEAVAVYEMPLSWLDWWPRDSAGAAAMAAADPGAAAEAFMRRLVGDDVWERLPAARRDDRRREGAAMVSELADLRRCAPWEPARVGAPVLVLVGEHARPHHRRAFDHLGEILPQVRRRTVDGAGHAGPHTHPDDVAAAVVEFVDDLTR
jgi:pimeloyl-ACP methyl ester carboxylesterase